MRSRLVSVFFFSSCFSNDEFRTVVKQVELFLNLLDEYYLLLFLLTRSEDRHGWYRLHGFVSYSLLLEQFNGEVEQGDFQVV